VGETGGVAVGVAVGETGGDARGDARGETGGGTSEGVGFLLVAVLNTEVVKFAIEASIMPFEVVLFKFSFKQFPKMLGVAVLF
jgi:hypothetical protein